MEQLSDRIKSLSESQTIAMSRRSRELRAKGIDVINLSLGEPDFDTPDFVKEAAKLAIDQNYSHYPPVPGFLELREAISKKFLRDNQLNYSSDQIVVSTGAKQSITNVVLSLVNQGDEVLLPAPYWVSYREMVKLAEGTPVIVPTTMESDFKITPEQLEASITDKTRLMIFSTPCNPTGSFYSKEELSGLAAVIEKHPGLFVVCDEIYEHINFSGEHYSLARFENIYDRVVTVNGVSKGFAMTGWRIGYIGAPLWIAKACTKMQGQITSGASTIAQKAAEAAVSADPSVTKPMLEKFIERRNLVLDRLREIPGLGINEPEGAFYVYPDVTSFFGMKWGDQVIENATDLCMLLLNEAHVAMVPGEAFGTPGHIRLSYAASNEELETAMSRLKQALTSLTR